jgi:hypothetical protein
MYLLFLSYPASMVQIFINVTVNYSMKHATNNLRTYDIWQKIWDQKANELSQNDLIGIMKNVVKINEFKKIGSPCLLL